MSSKQALPIIAYFMYCKCNKEWFRLVSHEGITDKAFRILQKEQVCDNCNSPDSLEFRPIRRGENLELIVNGMMEERKHTILDSFESKLRGSIQSLIDLRQARINSKQDIDEDKELGAYTFTNESIKQRLIDDSEADPDPNKKNAYYSAEIGWFSQSKITTVLKSKFKPKFPKPKKINGKTYRLVEFSQDVLDRLKASYEIPEKIEIVRRPVTQVTQVTLSGRTPKPSETDIGDLDLKIQEEIAKGGLKEYDNSNSKTNIQDSEAIEKENIPSKGVTTVTYVTCENCGITLEPFYMRIHDVKKPNRGHVRTR
jgi:hypothetical protein